ncbi:MAG: T9SS type A sorting domain-containing protein, partial [Bacteroidetes Order II. Incertae sedis bacterium]|nr:T9SS type A sorting domain-containing protein [Bacteroidetes Order II. bacterium]
TMEIVGMRYSDPNALQGGTYKGDMFYPLHTETGISIEPYFNWDIENWPLTAATVLTTLQLDVSLNSDLSSPVFTTTTKRSVNPLVNGTPLINKLPADTDHFITDADLDTGVPLLNDTDYYWGLTATLAGGATFKQISRFKTIPALLPALTYPKDQLTIPSLDFDFSWNVASAVQNAVYWRLDVDQNAKGAFNGSMPSNLGGDIKNDDNTLVADGYAEKTQFKSSNMPTPLTWGTTYSWRATTMWPVPPTGWVPQEIFDLNETDRTVSISSVFQFQTQTLAYVPTPSYPIGGSIIPSNEPLLSWWVGGPFGALTFEIQVREVGVPGTIVCTASGISGTQYDTSACAPSTLTPGKTYEWRVRSNDGTNTSDWSAAGADAGPWTSPAVFSTNGQGVAGTPTPSYPIDDLEIYTINPQLHWFTEKDNTGINFIAHYAKRAVLPGTAPASCAALKALPNTTPGDIFDLASPVSTTYVDAPGLEPGATYDWCVTSIGLNGSVEGTVATFQVAGGLAKNFPVASWPKPNPTVYSLTQDLTWYLEGSYFDVASYDVEYCKGIPTGSTPVFGAGAPSCTTVSGLTTQNYEVTGLTYGDVVIWRVKANYTSGTSSDWNVATSQGGFTVVGLLSTLTANPSFPIGDVVIYDTDPTLIWWVSGAVGAANAYKIQYSYTETFHPIGTVTIEATSTTPSIAVSNLIPGHTYWWRVAVSTDSGVTYGSWSAVASFAIHPGANAVMPRIGGPANNVSIETNAPTLSWLLPAPSESALTYDVRYSKSPDLEANSTLVEGLTTSVAQLANLDAGDYYWQVRSKTASGEISPYSPVGSFTTTASFSVGVEDEFSEQPAAFELGQNYPNPFNPTTTIEFRMSESANVSLKVYNVLGQVVKTLVSGTLPSGMHSVSWDATDDSGSAVTTGLYIYRMETDNFSATKSLVLMK